LPTAPEARIIDEAKRYKSTLTRAICNPFWDDAPQQEPNAHYPADKADVSGSSVAEATARAVCLLSFIRSLYEKHPVVVTKDGVAIPVGNIWKEKQLYSILFERDELPFKKYITTRFSGGKFDFSLVDDTHGFALIDNENQNEFIDSFRKFEELDWNAIQRTKGWIIKRITKNKKSKRYFSDDLWKKGIKKFKNHSAEQVFWLCG